MGGEIFQLVMVYLFAAQCATAPEDIVFKLSCCREIVHFSSLKPFFTSSDGTVTRSPSAAHR
jgi:hypothetical protein